MGSHDTDAFAAASATTETLAPGPVGFGRLLVAASNGRRRWVVAVGMSATASLVVAAAGAPSAFVPLAGLAVAFAAIGEVVAVIAQSRLARLKGELGEHLERLEALIAHQAMDHPTHGHLQPAAETLTAARDRLAAVPSRAADREIVETALDLVVRLEADIRASAGSRSGWRHGGSRVLGGLAPNTLDEEVKPSTMKLYGDQTNLPDSIPPGLRDALLRIGAVLDDVRLLHTSQIEWSVLLFTLWARFLLLVCAPFMASFTTIHVPLEDGLRLADVPWIAALTCATVTVATAPWLATAVMRRDTVGARTRRVLLGIEVPIAIAAIIAFPCWPVAAFAAGWTNWWQRPSFDWIKLGIWIAAVGGCQAIGIALAGEGTSSLLFEAAVTLAVIGVIGGSYGAMLPVSASMLIRVIAGGLFSSRRGQRRADSELGASIRQLFAAARVIEHGAPGIDARARIDANNLREVATTLAASADASDRWARRTPLGLRSVVGNALEKAGPATGSPTAELATAQAVELGEPEPVTLREAGFHTRELEQLRFRERGSARALSLLIVEIAREARRYGAGPMTTSCTDEDGRIVLRFANACRPEPVASGRGTGGKRLAKLVGGLSDGKLDVRGPVDGTFVSLPASVRRFGVQVSFGRDALEVEAR